MASDDRYFVAEDLRAGYGPLQILRGVTFSAAKGEVVGFFGRNGAGKTTLMETLSGLIQPSGGDVRLDGKSIAGRPAHVIARAGVSLVPQWRGLFPGLSVEDNLRLGCRAGGLSRAEATTRVGQTLEQFPGLGTRRSVHAGALSGGEQQLLAISKSLVRDPTVLMLDEPSIGLAPIIVDQVAEAIAGLRSSSRVILVAEQRIDWALDTIDRGFVIEGGALGASLQPESRGQWRSSVESFLGARLADDRGAGQ